MSTWRDEVHNAISALDELASNGPDPQGAIVDAIATATALAVCCIDDAQTALAHQRMLIAVCKQLYRAGYNAGRRDVVSSLGANRG